MHYRKLIPFFGIAMFIGCNRSHEAQHQPVLKTFLKRTDVLMSRRYFDAITINAEKKADELDGGVTTVWTPGRLLLRPIIASEPNDSDETHKGAAIVITDEKFTVSAAGIEPRSTGGDSHTSILDESELHDLDAALTYIIKVADDWSKAPPPVQTEVEFRAADEFSVDLGRSENRTGAFVSGGVPDAIALNLSVTELGQFQDALHRVVATLDSN